jgi:hypothetical protein
VLATRERERDAALTITQVRVQSGGRCAEAAGRFGSTRSRSAADLEVERGRVRRPDKVRGVEQPGSSVDARARDRGGCDGGHESADDHRAGAGPAGAEDDRRPCGVSALVAATRA